MINTRDYFGNEYTIQPCSAEDVDVHFDKISQYIPSEEVIQFKKRMSECILAESAYTLSDGSCFLYYLNYNQGCANGIALFGKHSPLKMLALFAGIFPAVDQDTKFIEFHLHKGKVVSEYKSILTMASIQRQSMKNHPLIINIHELHQKMSRLYKSRGLG